MCFKVKKIFVFSFRVLINVKPKARNRYLWDIACIFFSVKKLYIQEHQGGVPVNKKNLQIGQNIYSQSHH